MFPSSCFTSCQIFLKISMLICLSEYAAPLNSEQAARNRSLEGSCCVLQEFGLWGYCLPMTLAQKIEHYQIQGVSSISLGWMLLLLFLLAGLGNDKTEHGFQRCSWRGTCMHTRAHAHRCARLQKPTQTENIVVMAPT